MSARPSASCTFCDIIHGAGEVSLCYEDADSMAFMDIQPVNPGHVLVVPREHYESLADIPGDLAAHLFQVATRLAETVKGVTACEGMNLVVNSGAAAGQDVFHYHVHVIPRRAGDGFEIPLPFNQAASTDRYHLDAVAAQIIAAERDPMRSERSPRGGKGSGGGSAGGRIPSQGGGESAGERAASAPLPGGVRASAVSNQGSARASSAAAEDDVTRGARVIERVVEIAAFAEASGAFRDDVADAVPTRRHLGEVEGPHGELVRLDD